MLFPNFGLLCLFRHQLFGLPAPGRVHPPGSVAIEVLPIDTETLAWDPQHENLSLAFSKAFVGIKLVEVKSDVANSDSMKYLSEEWLVADELQRVKALN